MSNFMSDQKRQQRETNTNYLLEVLTDEIVDKIVDVGGPTKEEIVKWSMTGESLEGDRALIVGALLNLNSKNIQNGSTIETANICEDYTDCHAGHVGIRINGDMRFYPVARTTYRAVGAMMQNNNDLIQFPTQDNRWVVVTRKNIEELALLHENAEWDNNSEWLNGRPLMGLIRGQDYWRALYKASTNQSDLMTPEFKRYLFENHPAKEGPYQAMRTVRVLTDRSWHFVPTKSDLEQIKSDIDTGRKTYKFEDSSGAITKFYPSDRIKMIEIPLAFLSDAMETYP